MVITEEEIPYTSIERLRSLVIRSHVGQVLLAVAMCMILISWLIGISLLVVILFFASIILSLATRLFEHVTGKSTGKRIPADHSLLPELPIEMRYHFLQEDTERTKNLMSAYGLEPADLYDSDIIYFETTPVIADINNRYFQRDFVICGHHIFLNEWCFDEEHLELGVIDTDRSIYQVIKAFKTGTIPQITVVGNTVEVIWKEPTCKKKISITL